MLHPKIEELLQAQEKRVSLAKRMPLPDRGFKKRGFRPALLKKPFALIAEIKPASPAQGVLRTVHPGELAAELQSAGASAISVLTEQTQFNGSLEALAQAKAACSLPVLAKDFVIDEFQITEASSFGADAVLLIAEMLGDRLGAFMERARSEKVEVLVECFSARGLEFASEAGARVIGVNNRSFADLSVDINRTWELAPLVPQGSVFVAESGISSRKDIEKLLGCGVGAFLVGTSIMRAESPRAKIMELLGRRV